MSIIRETGEGLPLEMRFGGWAASCFVNSNARVVAQAAILAAVRHPEWAMAIMSELNQPRMAGGFTVEVWANRLVEGAFVEVVQ